MSTNTISVSDASAKRKYKKRGPVAEVFHRLRKNKGAILGAIIANGVCGSFLSIVLARAIGLIYIKSKIINSFLIFLFFS